MDPRTRLGLLACVGLLAVSLDRPGSLAALCVLCLIPLIALRLPRTRWLQGLGVTGAIVWGTVLSQGLFYSDLPRVALLELGPLTLWREGVTWGLVQSLRMVATLLAGLAVAAATPPDRLYAALLGVRVPFSLAFLAATALRSVPETAKAIGTVRRARARRGRPIWQRSPWAWLRLEVALLRPVVATALRRARDLAESLDSRGFDPSAPRAVRRPLAFARWEPPLLLVAGALTLGVVAMRLLYALYTAEAVYIQALRPVYGFVRAWL